MLNKPKVNLVKVDRKYKYVAEEEPIIYVDENNPDEGKVPEKPSLDSNSFSCDFASGYYGASGVWPLASG